MKKERKPKRVGVEVEDQAGSDPRWPNVKMPPIRQCAPPREYPKELPQEGDKPENQDK